jgi:dTDP-4-dehydrorhamnose 3,5-epimerase-like enzyme
MTKSPLIDGLYEIKPSFFFNDERGTITELFNDQNLGSVKHTLSNPGVLRGIHVQNHGKIIYPATGNVYSLFVDARRESPTYGTINQFIDYGPRHGLYYIPAGVGVSYCVIGDKPADIFYFSSKSFDADAVGSFSTEGFYYPIVNPILSEKDKDNTTLFKDYVWRP